MNRQRSLFNTFYFVEEFLLVLGWPFILALMVNTRFLRLVINVSSQPHYIFIYSALFVLSGFFLNRYQRPMIRKWIDEISSLWLIQVVHFLMTTFVFIYMHPELSRFSLVIVHGTLFFALSLHVLWGRFIQRKLFDANVLVENVLMINVSSHALDYIDTIKQNPRFTQIIKEVIVHDEATLEHIEDVIKHSSCFHAIISDEGQNHDWLKKVIHLCDQQGIQTSFLPYTQTFMTSPNQFDVIGQHKLYSTRDIPLNHFINRLIKRMLDILLSLFGLLVLFPLFVLIAILIKLTSPGSIFFTQERMGYQKKAFKLIKFRTMQEAKTQSWVGAHDPRITRVGHWLRVTSLDELPQLLNVLVGNMSCVGPRPERVEFIESLSQLVSHYQLKHTVKPGMTGWAQIHGYRGNTSLQKRIEHDLYYLQNWTLFLDLYILLRTVLLGFINKEEL
jgi:exopolysaccharide biosynthesis polyprenyl glycosylphosphotransferase